MSSLIRLACSAILLLLLALGVARAEPRVDLQATNRILKHVQTVLAKQGFGALHIGGGAALSLAMAARHGGELAWNDIDIRAFPRGPLDAARIDRLSKALTRGGWARVLAPGRLDFFVPVDSRPDTLRPQGFGLRMTDRQGNRYDIAVLNGTSEIATSGFNTAESLFIPLRPRDTIQRVMGRLTRGAAKEVVGRGDLQEVHGRALDVLGKKIAITNKHYIEAQPELLALRFLRDVGKLDKLGPAGERVGFRGAFRWLGRNLPRAIAHAPEVKDPSYVPQVQEQAQKLLESGDRRLLRAAARLGLDVPALAAGKLRRTATE